MTIQNDDRSGDNGTAPERNPHRPRILAVAAVAGVAVLGGGIFAITTRVGGNDRTTAQDIGVIAPVSASASPTAQASALPPASPSTSPVPVSPTAASPSPSKNRAVEKEIKTARAKAAKDGHPLQRPITPAPGIAAASGPVESRNVPRKDGSLRITTARFDLTGQRELLWAADKGDSVGGGIRCTQNFKFSNNNQARVRPTMLLCWRTSTSRSVVTVLVNRDGKPSEAESTAIIKSEWAKLG